MEHFPTIRNLKGPTRSIALNSGQEHTNLPPDGPYCGNADYITTGVITSSLAMVNLITFTSREVVHP